MLYNRVSSFIDPDSRMTLKSYLALITLATITTIVLAVGVVLGYSLQKTYLDSISQRGLELGRVIAHNEK